MASHSFDPVRAYGKGFILLRGGFLPNSSTTTAGAPLIPSVQFQASSPAQPRWGGFSVVHDPQVLGRFNVLLDDDYLDLLPHLQVERNALEVAPSVFIPSTTSGKGITVTGVQAGNGNLATIPIKSIKLSTPSSGGTTVVLGISGGNITSSTLNTGVTNAILAAYINAHTATLGIVASAGDSDVVVANGPLYFSAGFTGTETYGTAFLPSDTSTDGISIAAVNGGASPVSVVYVYSASGANPSVAVAGTVITVTIDNTSMTTKNTNTLVAAALAASTAAAALISVTNVVSLSDTNSSLNTAGVQLSGGGIAAVCLAGPTNPAANSLGVKLNRAGQIPSFSIDYSEGGVQADPGSRAILFVPSNGTHAGSGVAFSSVATAPVAASLLVVSNAGGTDGITFTAIPAGDAGNNISITYVGPYASLLLPSTTSGSGLLFTAVAAGQPGLGISVTCNVPTGVTSSVVVTGNSIVISPKAAETNAGLYSVLSGAAQVTAIVTVSEVGTTSDLISATAFATANLQGGNSLASGASVQMSTNNQGGPAILVTFAASATNTNVQTAINANAAAKALVSMSVSVGSDTVIATGMTYLAGGSQPSDLQVVYTQGAVATLAVTQVGNLCTVALGTTNSNNTNAKIAAAVNTAQADSALLQAVAVGTTADQNTLPFGGATPAPLNLSSNNLILIGVDARVSVSGNV